MSLNSIPLLQPTPVEVEKIRLSLMELRRTKGMSMIGVDSWRLYYPIANKENVPPLMSARCLHPSASDTALHYLITVANEHLSEESSSAPVAF